MEHGLDTIWLKEWNILLFKLEFVCVHVFRYLHCIQNATGFKIRWPDPGRMPVWRWHAVSFSKDVSRKLMISKFKGLDNIEQRILVLCLPDSFLT